MQGAQALRRKGGLGVYFYANKFFVYFVCNFRMFRVENTARAQTSNCTCTGKRTRANEKKILKPGDRHERVLQFKAGTILQIKNHHQSFMAHGMGSKPKRKSADQVPQYLLLAPEGAKILVVRQQDVERPSIVRFDLAIMFSQESSKHIIQKSFNGTGDCTVFMFNAPKKVGVREFDVDYVMTVPSKSIVKISSRSISEPSILKIEKIEKGFLMVLHRKSIQAEVGKALVHLHCDSAPVNLHEYGFLADERTTMQFLQILQAIVKNGEKKMDLVEIKDIVDCSEAAMFGKSKTGEDHQKKWGYCLFVFSRLAQKVVNFESFDMEAISFLKTKTLKFENKLFAHYA